MGLRPLLGPAKCCYELGCTQYAILQLQNAPFFVACTMIALRLLKCNPLTIFFRSFTCLKNKRF